MRLELFAHLAHLPRTAGLFFQCGAKGLAIHWESSSGRVQDVMKPRQAALSLGRLGRLWTWSYSTLGY